jgi:hypothetical protein
MLPNVKRDAGSVILALFLRGEGYRAPPPGQSTTRAVCRMISRSNKMLKFFT